MPRSGTLVIIQKTIRVEEVEKVVCLEVVVTPRWCLQMAETRLRYLVAVMVVVVVVTVGQTNFHDTGCQSSRREIVDTLSLPGYCCCHDML